MAMEAKHVSIRSKIIFYMLLVSLVPIVIVSVLVYINMSGTRDSVNSSVNQSRVQLQAGLEKGRAAMEQNSLGFDMINMSELMLSQLSSYFTERVQDINDWSKDTRVIDALRDGGNGEAGAFINRNVEHSLIIDQASVCDLEGNTVIQTSSATSPIQHYKDWWKAAVDGQLYVGDLIRPTDIDAFSVQVGIPVVDPENGELVGALEATLLMSPDHIADTWGGRIPGGSILLVDRNCELIADSSDLERHLQDDPYWSRAEQKAIEQLEKEDVDNGYVEESDEAVVFSRWVSDEKSAEYFNGTEAPDFGWAIMIRMPASVAFAPFEAIDADNILGDMEKLEADVDSDTSSVLIFLMVILVLVGMVVSVMAIWISRGLTDPIVKLHRGVLEVINGNRDHKVGSEANDEIGQLSRAFDEMTAAENRAQAHLKNYSKSLERMVENRTQYLQDEVAVRERTEEELRAANAQLQQAHEELKTSEEQLMQSAKLAAVGQLVSGVAHEVNNPLMAILGNTELLLKKMQTEDERSQKRLQRIHNETNRAITIVRNLLSFARKQESEKVPVSVNESLESVVQLRSYEMSLENIDIETDLAPDLPDIMGDHQQLQQVFLNLLINAEQAIKRNSESGKVIIRTEPAGKRKVRVTFTDDGPGIPDEIQGRIFEPFFTTKDVGEGTGLGLSICYGIIEDHKGNITAKSNEGNGATFTIEFPVAPKSAKKSS